MAKIGTGAAEGKRTAYINANVLDGTEGMEMLENHAVVVEGRRIVDVTPLADADLSGCETFDLKGAYLLPGLINMHVHLAGNGKPQKKQRDNEALVRNIMSNGLTRAVAYRLVSEYARMELHSGVTTIRTVGGLGDFDTRVRDDAAAGKLEAPRILAANMGISVPGGHMAGSVAIAANNIPEALAQVEVARSQGVDLIKLMITGGVLDAEVVGEPGVLRMQPALVKAACDKAHALGMKVAAHVESPEGVRVALENGVESIEHGAQPDAAITALYKEKGAFQVATLSPALPYALFDRSVSHATYEQQENGKVVFDGIIAMARENLANGIPVGLGTDTGCPYITHYDMWRELCYFVKYCGVTPAFALHTATLLNARLAGIDGETGSIEAGKAADLIVCAKDPLADLSALRTLSMVIKDGYRVEHPAPKKLPEVERELDKFL